MSFFFDRSNQFHYMYSCGILFNHRIGANFQAGANWTHYGLYNLLRAPFCLYYTRNDASYPLYFYPNILLNLFRKHPNFVCSALPLKLTPVHSPQTQFKLFNNRDQDKSIKKFLSFETWMLSL